MLLVSPIGPLSPELSIPDFHKLPDQAPKLPTFDSFSPIELQVMEVMAAKTTALVSVLSAPSTLSQRKNQLYDRLDKLTTPNEKRQLKESWLNQESVRLREARDKMTADKFEVLGTLGHGKGYPCCMDSWQWRDSSSSLLVFFDGKKGCVHIKDSSEMLEPFTHHLFPATFPA
jgi:hypothetical protein